MKQSTSSMLVAVVLAFVCGASELHGRHGMAFILGLAAVYFLVKAEVLHRSDL